MSAAITTALRVAMAEQWSRHVAETSAGCRAVLSAAVGDSGTPPARVLLRCVLAPHDGPTHETLLPDGTRAPFEVPVTGATQKRFTDDEVRAIRAEYAAGGVRQADLAARYGVSQSTISDLLTGAKYGWVQ